MAAEITGIYRYPVKGFSPEAMPSVDLLPGATIPFDRAYAIENGPTGFDPAAPSYFPKIRFLMLMRNERVARLKTTFDPATTLWRIEEDGVLAIEGRLNRADDRASIEAWIARHFKAELRGAPKILAGDGHSFSDVARKVVHVVNLASVRDLERHLGHPIDPLRFRANVYIDGLPAWGEFDWTGKSVVRCAATNVDPTTGARDLDIPKDLMRLYGHTDCGIYLEVTAGGRLVIGDTLDLRQMVLDLG